MKNTPIEVFIVDDSRVSRDLLTHILESDPELKVVGYAEDGDLALQWLLTHSCDVITMDIHMPHFNGFEATKKIMESKPLPTVIISAGYTPTDNFLAFKALEAGALAILEKPAGLGDVNFARRAKDIIDTVKMISDIKVVTRRHKRTFGEMKDSPSKIEQRKEIRAVGIGASLGGPVAISKILEDLPASFPVPIFIVQHIAIGFTEDFIRWLQEKSKLRIYAAKDGEKAKPGCVYIAIDECQMEVKKGDIISLDYTSKSTIQPSAARLFKSLANTYGANCAGVILTGMGKDGAAELLMMKQMGAYTIAQDEKSSLMFGMPKEAILIEAACEVLPLNLIASALNTLVEKQSNRSN